MLRKILSFLLLVISLTVFGQDSATIKPVILSNSKNDLNAVAVAPAKLKRMAIGGWDNDIFIYQTDTPYKLVQKLTGHTAAINALTYSFSGNMMASASGDMTVRVYDSMYRYVPFAEDMVNRHQAPVSCLTFDRTGRFLFSGDKQGKLLLWDIVNKKPIKFYQTSNSINDICLSPTNANIFVAHADKQIKVIALAGGATVRTLDGHTDIVNVVAISPNNQYLISGSNDKTARIWNLKTWKPLQVLKVESWKVTAVAFTDDSKYCVTGCNDGSIKVWEIATGKMVSSASFPELNIRDIAFLRSNQCLVFTPKLKEEGEFGARIIPSEIPGTKIQALPVKSMNPEQRAKDSIMNIRTINKQDSERVKPNQSKNNQNEPIITQTEIIPAKDSVVVTKKPAKPAPRRY